MTPISNTLVASGQTIQRVCAPPVPFTVKEAIKRIAKETFAELGLAMVSCGVACFFISTPQGMLLLLAGSVSILAVNILLRTLREYLRKCKEETPEDDSNYKWLKLSESFMDSATAWTYSNIDETTRSTLVHEAGHVVASYAMYQDPRPAVTLNPFQGAMTKFTVKTLSSLGERVGKTTARVIVSAAGPIFGVGLSIADIIAGHYTKYKYPKISLYFDSAAANNITSTAFYALSALISSTTVAGHDFMSLWKLGGIHPLTATVFVIGAPVLVKTTLLLIDGIRDAIKETRPIRHQVAMSGS